MSPAPKSKKKAPAHTTEDIQTRKLVSSYGGIGSIIETRQGALLISPFDQWPFAIKGPFGRECDKPAYRIEDDRLLARLRSHFTKLTRLVRLPTKDSDNRFGGGLPSKQAAARYFPRWMYCPGCTRFHPLEEWQEKWHNTVSAAERLQFDPPRCGWCYANPDVKGKFHPLEQVRFLMTSPSGRIADVPWPQWALRNVRPATPDDTTADHDEVTEGSGTRLDMHTPLPAGMSLRYRTAAKFGDLKGIIITAVDAEGAEIGRSTLAGIFGLRVPEAALMQYGQGSVLMKAVLRSSTSVYYPNIVQSLFLPTATTAGAGLSEAVLDKLRELHGKGRNAKYLLDFLADQHDLRITADTLAQIVAGGFRMPPPTALPPEEEAYRQAEYNFITQQPAGRFHDLDLTIEPVESDESVLGIVALYRLDKLKLTSVQTSYTRQQPLERDAILANNAPDASTVQHCYTTSFGNATYMLPAVESYGEGLFIELDAAELALWEADEAVQAQAEMLQQNWLRLPSAGDQPRRHLARFVLLHTLSHLLIKELEFRCGYPATSLQERLYVGADMQGILLYTIAGSEGSYGGLVSLGRENRLTDLLQSALHRATDCAADPICWHTDEQGQGVGGLNLAACASCTLLPETSCEEFNSLLDRRLVVDEEFGYFRDVVAQANA